MISKQYKELYPRGSQPGIMNALSKIHKPLNNNFPKLLLILLAIDAATYGWAKVFDFLLKRFTENKYTFKDSFGFGKDINNQSSNCFMELLDVDSLFTNIPLDKNIIIFINELFKSEITVLSLNKREYLKCFH